MLVTRLVEVIVDIKAKTMTVKNISVYLTEIGLITATLSSEHNFNPNKGLPQQLDQIGHVDNLVVI